MDCPSRRSGRQAPDGAAGYEAVASIVAASERLTEASPSIRVFMESGDEAESEPDPAHPTLVLDVYAAGSAPGLAAVVKGTPATTLVLWRCLKNRLTHAWVAPDRDDYAADWAAVDEDRFLQSRAMAATNEVLAEQLPPGRDYWNFHQRHADIAHPRASGVSIITVHPVLTSPPSLHAFRRCARQAGRVHGPSALAPEHAPPGVRRHARAGRDAGGPLVPRETRRCGCRRGARSRAPPTRTAPCPVRARPGAGRRPDGGGRGAAAGEELRYGDAGVGRRRRQRGGSPRPARNSEIGMPVWVGCVARCACSRRALAPASKTSAAVGSRFWSHGSLQGCRCRIARSSLCSMTEWQDAPEEALSSAVAKLVSTLTIDE